MPGTALRYAAGEFAAVKKLYHICRGSTTFFAFARDLCYNGRMLSVLLQKREGYAFCYALQEGGAVFYGGMTPAGELVCDEACTQKELMLRTLVFKCMNDFVPRVYTRGVWGVPPERFGFPREGEAYAAELADLRLPHDCGE